MTKKTLQLVAFSIAFLVSANVLANSTKGFQDVLRTHDQFVAIDHLRKVETIGGYTDGTFKPDQAINRAEVLKVILQGSGIQPENEGVATVFSDIEEGAWFAKYVDKAKSLGIVSGDASTGLFSAERQVNKAEFLKMLLLANQIKLEEIVTEEPIADDVPNEAWFTPYINYALKSGIISKNEQNMAMPDKAINRAEAAEMMYLLLLINKKSDTQFLLHRAEAELAQIEVYIAANKVNQAKKAGELAVSLTQQAIKNLPNDKVVLGAGKLAKAYNWLVDSFIYGIQKNKEESEKWANEAIKKATEAWEVNKATQPIARHIKDRAREILAQIGGSEK